MRLWKDQIEQWKYTTANQRSCEALRQQCENIVQVIEQRTNSVLTQAQTASYNQQRAATELAAAVHATLTHSEAAQMRQLEGLRDALKAAALRRVQVLVPV